MARISMAERAEAVGISGAGTESDRYICTYRSAWITLYTNMCFLSVNPYIGVYTTNMTEL